MLPVKAETTALEVIKSGTPSISSFNRGTGSTENGILVIEMCTLQVLEWYGVEWAGSQIRECAEMIHSEYHWLLLAEMKHFVLKAKRGDFNKKTRDSKFEENDAKIYGKLTPATFLRWVHNYAQESLFNRAGAFNEHSPASTQNKPENTIQFDAAAYFAKMKEALAEERRKTQVAAEEERKKSKEKSFARMIEDYAKENHVNIDEIAKQFKP